MESSPLVRFNRFFMLYCAYWAVVNRELNIPTKKWLLVIDRLTKLWSSVIVVTCMIKFFKYPQRGGPFDQSSAAAIKSLGGNQSHDHEEPLDEGRPAFEQRDVDWTEVLLLNYLPRINQFSALFYGLVLIAVGTALFWRVYMHNIRELPPRGSFDAMTEIMHFFLAGPSASQMTQHDSELGRDQERRLIELYQSSLTPPSLPKKSALLTRAHINEFAQPWEKCPNPLTRVFDGQQLVQRYQIPVGGPVDFLEDKSLRRWRHLFVRVYSFVVFVGLCTIPLVYYTIVGLDRVNVKFGPLESVSKLRSFKEIKRIYFEGSARQRANLYLSCYGLVEQAYACTQLTIFFIYTNIFIVLFHADLTYKVRPILRDIKSLQQLYSERLVETMPVERVFRQKLRIWAFFDQIRMVDRYLSKYSVVSLAALSVGITFGQSFFRVHDRQLRLGTLASLFSNIVSFSYLHFISENIERQSGPIQAGILAILAGERNPETKREWQRLLNGFFRSNLKRTFTIFGKYPTNLNTLTKTATALLAACTLIHRLFHRPIWTMSFSGVATATAAASGSQP